MNIPSQFIWSRYGTEAGETVSSILERKEQERINNNGIFYWGIGNSLTQSLSFLDNKEVLFSPISSKAKDIDINPQSIKRWHTGRDLENNIRVIPETINVTSRGDKKQHYALICYSEDPLVLSDYGKVYLGFLRNIRSGKRVAGQQITSVVRNHTCSSLMMKEYPVTMKFKLAYPYFLTLTA